MAIIKDSHDTELVTNAPAQIATRTKSAPKPQKAPKEREPQSAKASSKHPNQVRVIMGAIASLKERKASSHHAIAKYLEDKYKDSLPANFKESLFAQLKSLTAGGKLTKVKNSFQLPKESLKKMSKVSVRKAPKTVKTFKGAVSKDVKKKHVGPKIVFKTTAKRRLTSLKIVKKETKTKATKKAKTKVKSEKAVNKVKLNKSPVKKRISTGKKSVTRKA